MSLTGSTLAMRRAFSGRRWPEGISGSGLSRFSMGEKY